MLLKPAFGFSHIFRNRRTKISGMERRGGILLAGLCLLSSLCAGPLSAHAESPQRPPNLVVIFTDDQGYADVGSYGAQGFETPHLDRMAAEGMRFTDFHVAAAVCGASRAALMTGCYPQRLGILGAPGPNSNYGIDEAELLMPEMLKMRNYATAIYGKWHLGDHLRFRPTRHGFDDYFGLPYSNDMWPFHPTAGERYPKLPLIEGEEVIELNPDQTKLTTQYTERAVKFIEQHRDEPFFLYVPHNMPHVPLHVSEKFRGKSQQGLYGDVIMEIDWSVGEILAAIKATGNDERTLVVFATDNGPWLSYGNHAGSAGIFREGKGTVWEGGQRVPCIMRWPGKIPAGKECDELCTSLDFLPTFAALAGIEVPADLPRQKPPTAKAGNSPSATATESPTEKTESPRFRFAPDGHDIRPLMFGEAGAKSPYEAFYYYWIGGLEAVRSGEWKLHFPHKYRSLTGQPGQDGRPGGYSVGTTELALYNLHDDPSEKHNLVKEQPEVVSRLQQLGEAAREDLGDTLTKRKGSGVRGPARVE
jgi:arylsulfatase A-like enzyme